MIQEMKTIKKFNDTVTWFDAALYRPEENNCYLISDGEGFAFGVYLNGGWAPSNKNKEQDISPAYWAFLTTPLDAVPGAHGIGLGYMHSRELEEVLGLVEDFLCATAPYSATDPDVEALLSKVTNTLSDIMATRNMVAPQIAYTLWQKGLITDGLADLAGKGELAVTKQIFSRWWQWASDSVTMESVSPTPKGIEN